MDLEQSWAVILECIERVLSGVAINQCSIFSLRIENRICFFKIFIIVFVFLIRLHTAFRVIGYPADPVSVQIRYPSAVLFNWFGTITNCIDV